MKPVQAFVLPEDLTSGGAASLSWGDALRAGIPATPAMLKQTLERKVSQGSELWAQPDPASVKTSRASCARVLPLLSEPGQAGGGVSRQGQGWGEWGGGWGAGLSTPRTSEDCCCGGRGQGIVGLNTSARLTLFLSVKQILSLSLQSISSFASHPVAGYRVSPQQP